MPVINIEFDDAKVSDEEAHQLSVAVQRIVSDITLIEEVFVYANSARIKVKVDPIWIFVSMTAHKISNIDTMFADVKDRVSSWKHKTQFKHSINLALTPESWKFEMGI